jgi:hypothetical protein
VERERATCAHADDLSDFELHASAASGRGIDFGHAVPAGARVLIEAGDRPAITLVKRFIFRLQFYVLDDLARQADAAIARVEAALAVETAMRERLKRELEDKTRDLESKIRELEGQRRQTGAP